MIIKKGAFCEILLDDGSSQYVIIKPKEYVFDSSIKHLIEQGVPLETIYPEVKLLGYEPNEEVSWLYFIMTFIVKKQFHDNQAVFAEHKEFYAEYAFDDFDKVINFCSEKFNIGIADFRKDWETNYPQW